MASMEEIVTLDVGGTLFSTTLTTLRQYPGSVLAAMFDPSSASSSLVVQLRFQLRFGNANAIGTLTKEQNCKFQLHLRFRGSICVSGVP